MEKYLEDDHVMIHSLGPSYKNKEFRGIVRGISVDGPARIYIVEMIDKLEPLNYIYSCCTMPAACLKRGWSTYKSTGN